LPQVNQKIRVLQSSSNPRANRTSGAYYFLFLLFDIFFAHLQIYNEDPCLFVRSCFAVSVKEVHWSVSFCSSPQKWARIPPLQVWHYQQGQVGLSPYF
jgi:hypothetical protein